MLDLLLRQVEHHLWEKCADSEFRVAICKSHSAYVLIEVINQFIMMNVEKLLMERDNYASISLDSWLNRGVILRLREERRECHNEKQGFYISSYHSSIFILL